MNLRRTQNLENIDIIPLIPKIERLCRANRATRRRERMAEISRHRDEQEEEMGQLQGAHNGGGNGQALLVRMNMREIQRPVIGTSPSCIRLSPAARNSELKNIQFNMLPSFNELPDFLEGVLHNNSDLSSS